MGCNWCHNRGHVRNSINEGATIPCPDCNPDLTLAFCTKCEERFPEDMMSEEEPDICIPCAELETAYKTEEAENV